MFVNRILNDNVIEPYSEQRCYYFQPSKYACLDISPMSSSSLLITVCCHHYETYDLGVSSTTTKKVLKTGPEQNDSIIYNFPSIFFVTMIDLIKIEASSSASRNSK